METLEKLPLQNWEQRLTRVADLRPYEYEPTCMICRDTGWQRIEGKGVKPCSCRVVNLFSAIPEEFRSLVMTFRPNARYPKQAAAFTRVQANPRGSYLLAGDFGSGKTALGWWFVKTAIETGRNYRYYRLPDLLDEFRVWENTDRHTKPPSLTRDVIQYSHDLLIVLDEVDKTYGVDGATEYAMRKLLQLFDAACQWQRQIVCLSNLSSGQLEAKYTKIDEVSGYAVMRRMMQMCEELEMF